MVVLVVRIAGQAREENLLEVTGDRQQVTGCFCALSSRLHIGGLAR